LPGIEAAAREAVSALANISKDVRKQYKDRVLALKVRDQSGETVLNVTLSLAVTWFPASQIELCEHASAGPAQIPGYTVGDARIHDTHGPPVYSADRPRWWRMPEKFIIPACEHIVYGGFCQAVADGSATIRSCRRLRRWWPGPDEWSSELTCVGRSSRGNV
jgi:hypothetical protein